MTEEKRKRLMLWFSGFGMGWGIAWLMAIFTFSPY
jgi:hypothetical protein